MSGARLAVFAGLAAGAAVAAGFLFRRSNRRFRRTALFRIRRHGIRISRFRFAPKADVRARVLESPALVARIEETARQEGVPPQDVRERVEEYLEEIVPAFSLVSYYRIGAALARRVLAFFYRVTVDRRSAGRFHRSIPPEATVVYVMNHRSNVDYLLVGLMLMKSIAISYAVGEWARVWPLETLFKSFGSYFVRRKFRNELYHAALSEYVRLITREGTTQGIFLEGGLTRDGALREPKIGLLDYILRAMNDPDFSRPLFFVPCGLNYDRVIEDRVLTAELYGDRRTLGRTRRLRTTLRYVFSNSWRAFRRKFKRYGYAAVYFGEPLDAHVYAAELPEPWSAMSEETRREQAKALAAVLMKRIGRAVPALPVPIVARAWRGLPPGRPVLRVQAVAAVGRERAALEAAGAPEPTRRRSDSEVLDAALLVLAPRRILTESAEGIALVEKDADLFEYYAKSLDQFVPRGDGG
jgi:glycerol-3-phosphate O-acyltransferase